MSRRPSIVAKRSQASLKMLLDGTFATLTQKFRSGLHALNASHVLINELSRGDTYRQRRVQQVVLRNHLPKRSCEDLAQA